VWASLAALRRFPFLSVRIEVEGAKRVYATPLVFVGNNEYRMEAFRIGERDRIDRGHLSVYIVKRQGRSGLVRLALQALVGRLRQARDFEALSTTEFVIETRHARILVATDGEAEPMETPLRYRTRPRSLRVLVPRHEG
jgi:diacylglycerol kinase family enzyme